ncbi:hypothetical protein GZH47_31775 (plasmid) [Paenibacillus rhizovicinus]|uniref:Uncharacterized protein n=1 Tax=Paenibacillus rhizovicinus TaxID=2704463 RepID=A0A6C0PA95_9BACL|nr:hypothetical protein [Paenibacillus rhizovicinus]QHW35477.1 hypothetical protein GZH47_31775 [Paenibacillus rhizovicinus]
MIMLNESDLFVELLDEKELNRVVKKLNVVIEGFRAGNAPIGKMRDKLKSIFRTGLTDNRKKSKPGTTVFLDVLNLYTISHMDTISNEQYLAVLSECKFPDHVKFAYTWAKRNDIGRDILPDLISRHEKNEVLFDYNTKIETEREAVEHVKGFNLIGSQVRSTKLIELVEQKMDSAAKEKLALIEKRVHSLELHEIIKVENVLTTELECSSSLIYFAFAKLRSDLDQEVRCYYATSVLIQMFDEKSDMLKHLHDEVNAQKKSTRLMKKEIKDANETLAIETEKNIRFIKEAADKEQQLREEHQNQMNALKLQFETHLETLKADSQEAKNNVIPWLDRIAGWAGERDPVHEFAIIYSQQTEIFIELYPEITSFSKEEWKHSVTELSQYPHIYVQRDGFSTRELMEIHQKIKHAVTFNAAGDKELIEHVEEIKKREGVLFVNI